MKEHYEKYLEYLGVYSIRFDVDVIAYALMTWHVHLFLLDRLEKISQFMKALHGNYARYLNRTAGRVGHAFGERYNSRVVHDTEDALWLSRYIHRQAVEAGLVKHPRDYRWTSYRAYVGLSAVNFLKPGFVLEQFGSGEGVFERYEDFVMGEGEGPVDWTDFTESTQDGESQADESTGAAGVVYGETPDRKGLLAAVEARVGLDSEKLLNPRGREQRALRHEAFSILANEFGLSDSQVARVFEVSPNAVGKVLRRRV
jgi:putative transposase